LLPNKYKFEAQALDPKERLAQQHDH